MTANKKEAPEHAGSTFDTFLEEEGTRTEVEAVAVKRVPAWQLSRIKEQKTKNKKPPLYGRLH